MGPAEAFGGACQHAFCNSFGPLQYLMVPESDYRPSAVLEVARPHFIQRIIKVLFAVDFYN